MDPMKKLLSLLCVLAVTVGILAVGVVSASADVPATVLDVKSGDKVTYKLSLSGVPQKIVGCDFSVYYDSSVFKLDSVADFNDSTNDEDWQATINPDLDGEVRGNWSILKGVNFSKKRNIVTLNLTATKDGKAHISYFVRYMYDETVFDSDDRPQIDQYLFTCDVTKNGEAVVADAEPELNVEEEQPNGLFENSRNGKSDNKDKALTGDSIKANGGAADGQGTPGNNNSSGNSADNKSKNKTNKNSGNSSGGNNSGGNSSSGGNDSSGNKTNKDSGSNSNKQSATASADKSNPKNDAQKATEADKSKNKSDKEGATGVNAPKAGTTDATVENAVQTDADGKILSNGSDKANTAEVKDKGGSSGLMWIIIAAVVLIAGGSIAYVVIKGKKNPAQKTKKYHNYDDDDDDDYDDSDGDE